MPLKDFTLDREFKISALFFLDPYNINENIFGDLFYTKDQIYIVLSSTVDSSSEIFTMYGFSDSGRLLVLNDCFVNHNRTPSAGFSRDRVIVNSFYILESTSIPLIDDEKITEKILNQFNLTQDDPLIADLKFNFECLNDLHNETLFKFNYEENENEDKEMLIVDDFNKIVNESYIENIKLNIKEKVLASLNYKKHDYHWSENFNFILSFEKNNMKFSEYMKYAKDIKNIYSYIAGRNLNFNDIQFTIKFEDMF